MKQLEFLKKVINVKCVVESSYTPLKALFANDSQSKEKEILEILSSSNDDKVLLCSPLDKKRRFTNASDDEATKLSTKLHRKF